MNKRNPESGVVSFLTVIFVSILLMIMTTAFIRLMINEQRQATDNDLSTRAFYAAESGVTDAIEELRAALADGEIVDDDIETRKCGTGEILSAAAEISYTCKFISLDTAQVEGQLDEGQSISLDFVDMTNVVSARVSWHLASNDKDKMPFTGNATYPIAGTNLAGTSWKAVNIPAILRLQSVRYQEGGITSSGGIDSDLTYAYPVYSGGTTTAPQNLSVSEAKGPTNSTCSKPTGASPNQYACQIRFTGLGSKSGKFLELQALNNSTNYKIELLNKHGEVVTVPNQIATIDVTGKAGADVFRRVRVFVPLSGDTGSSTGSGDRELLPKQALLVDKGICKHFEVSGGKANNNLGCD